MSWLTLRWRFVEVAVVSKVFLPDRGEHDPRNTAPGQDCRLPHPPHTHSYTLQILSSPAYKYTLTNTHKYIYTCSLGLLLISLANQKSKQLVISLTLFWPVSYGALSLWDGCSLSLVASAYWLLLLFKSYLMLPGVNEKNKNCCTTCFFFVFLSILRPCKLNGFLILRFCCFEGFRSGLSSCYWLLCVTDATEGKHRAWNLSCQLPSCTFLHWNVLMAQVWGQERNNITASLYLPSTSPGDSHAVSILIKGDLLTYGLLQSHIV